MSNTDLWKIFIAEQENNAIGHDTLNRFLFRETSEKGLIKPIVSSFLYNSGFRPHYPNGKPFAVCISHDVDHLFNHNFKLLDRVKAAGGDFLRGNVNRTLRYMNLRNPINPNYNLEELLRWEVKKKIKSSYYFLSLKHTEQDFNYNLEEILPLFNEILNSGSEIGLHGGHEAFRSKEKIVAEKNLLEKNAKVSVRGYRNHFLRFMMPDTWSIQEQAGFTYDTTFGFPDHPGYRNGMCYPFFPYSAAEKRFLNILEIPLVAMDATFIYYLKWDSNQSLAYLKQMVDEIREINGVFTLLWHNNYLFKPWNTVFKSIVEYCIDQDAWFASGIELNDWWRKNDFSSEYKEYGLGENY